MRSILKPYIEALGRYGLLWVEIGKDIFRGGVNFTELNRQIIKIGVSSIPVILLTAIFTGMVLALQTAYGLQRFGAKNYVGNISGLALLRELGPVLTALMLCGRVGAGITAELASMVVTEQVDAMRALGANPIRKLVSPKVLAALIVIPLLAAMANVIGIYGGALVAVFELNISAHMYYNSMLSTLKMRDLVDGLIKSGIFGLLIVSIACYKGLNTRGGTSGVGQGTTDAVVTGSIVVLVSDFFITKALILLTF